MPHVTASKWRDRGKLKVAGGLDAMPLCGAMPAASISRVLRPSAAITQPCSITWTRNGVSGTYTHSIANMGDGGVAKSFPFILRFCEASRGYKWEQWRLLQAAAQLSRQLRNAEVEFSALAESHRTPLLAGRSTQCCSSALVSRSGAAVRTATPCTPAAAVPARHLVRCCPPGNPADDRINNSLFGDCGIPRTKRVQLHCEPAGQGELAVWVRTLRGRCIPAG